LNLKKNKKEVYVPYPVHFDFPRPYDPVYPKVTWTDTSVNTACCENTNKDNLNYKQTVAPCSSLK
jgi:hypothetical protein